MELKVIRSIRDPIQASGFCTHWEYETAFDWSLVRISAPSGFASGSPIECCVGELFFFDLSHHNRPGRC